MDDRIAPDSLSDPCAAAAGWFAKMRSGRMSETEHQQFEAWLRADPQHVVEYRRAEGIWNAVSLIPEERRQALTQADAMTASRARQKQSNPTTINRRRLTLGVGLACTTGAMAASWPLLLASAPVYTANFSTVPGQRRTEVLPGGSVLDLNTSSRLSVNIYEDRCVMALDAGEVAFNVARGASLPIEVAAGNTLIRATETLCNVRRDGNTVHIAVASGSVDVLYGAWWRRRMHLDPGQAASTSPDAGLAAAHAIDTETILAWRHGLLVFRGARLIDAIAELNRYARQPIKLGDPSLASLRVAGVFSTDTPQSFLELLPDILPVRLALRADGSAMILAR